MRSRTRLTREQAAFAARVVTSGEQQNSMGAVRVYPQRSRTDERKLRALRTQIKLGVTALDVGDAIDINVRDLPRFLDTLMPSRARVRLRTPRR